MVLGASQQRHRTLPSGRGRGLEEVVDVCSVVVRARVNEQAKWGSLYATGGGPPAERGRGECGSTPIAVRIKRTAHKTWRVSAIWTITNSALA